MYGLLFLTLRIGHSKDGILYKLQRTSMKELHVLRHVNSPANIRMSKTKKSTLCALKISFRLLGRSMRI